MGLIPRTGDTGGANGLCTTPACINIADNILGGMALDHSAIDPCTNFDELVCGNWPARNPLPPGVPQFYALSAIRFNTLEIVRNILEKPYPSESWITVNFTKEQTAIDKENFAKIQGAYQVCMNSTAHEEEGLSQLRGVVKTVAEKFPATSNSVRGANMTYDHAASMGETLAFFESLGIETTQRFYQSQYPKDPSKMILSLNTAETSGNPTDKDIIPEWLLLASELLRVAHPANLTKSKAYSLMQSVFVFQAELPPKDGDAPVTNATTAPETIYLSLPELNKLAPHFNYKYVIEQLAPAGTDTSMIAMQALPYWSRLSKTISKTPPEVLQAFFIWRSIAALSPLVDSPQTNAWNLFQTKRQQGDDPASIQPRWAKCVVLLDEGVPWTKGVDNVGPTGLTWLLARFFADKHITPEAKQFTSEIIANLEEAFISRVQTREWATDEVKQAAIEKVHAMGVKIGLPTTPLVTDPRSLKEFYSDVTITKSHVLNALLFAKSQIRRNWSSLNKPFDKGQFLSSTLLTNAYHATRENAMVIQSGVMQTPLFSPNYPAYLAYGGMGSVVGHEITHGFDGTGHTFDKTGNESAWFDEKSSKGFEDATKCFIKQYSNFTVTDPDGEENNVDGEVTLNENVADAGGILAAYSAWKRYEQEHGKALDLPGLASYSHDQLFFIKYGQNWCENLGSDGSNDLKDEHAPNRARILLPLENSVDFQKAFNCPKKEPTFR
ncbi:uncharacterized protein B0J16DRAFT_392874 [Fusarium flagelliforme]|uniref:uncharacterized protein n=1 Tax=Fusarium flagelliforme TaxID=2675880 RepID=UPI001E8DB0C4|nr:uncharacterized protein B0J16DRAFT_392874 [Fusarium flagelliforme]KAH7198964.1 hypothetical protein B0J16DRAFT_392874 [Fusarium flagelliforme]